MTRLIIGCLLACWTLGAQDPVFRAAVSVVRVDAQVLEKNRPLANLQRQDFVLREGGAVQEIRYFSRDEEPLDLLLLLDCSRSMDAHVSRVADSAHLALKQLKPGDRVAIMTFTRQSRLGAGCDGDLDHVADQLDQVIRDEDFRGGTDIHGALFDAGRFLRAEARQNARRAILIVTDDMTERARKDSLVIRALWQADAVLNSLVIGYQMNGGGMLGHLVRSRPPHNVDHAGVEQLSEQTGGESIRAKDAGKALQDLFTRIRLRYSLHYHLPVDAKPGETRQISVELSDEARARHPQALIRARRGYTVAEAEK